MFLYSYKSKKNKNKITARYIYTEIININKHIISKGILINNNHFNLAFEINSILLFCFFFGNKLSCSHKNNNLYQEIMNIFVNDLDNSFRANGIGDMKIGKYVKKTINKFYFRLKKLEFIFNNDDINEFRNYLINLGLFEKLNHEEKNINFLFKNCKELIARTKNDEINKSILNKLFN
tara:strand:+ start:644 stop:1177 length:534 start_codon:yes stop_codon:yes gene_type:complete